MCFQTALHGKYTRLHQQPCRAIFNTFSQPERVLLFTTPHALAYSQHRGLIGQHLRPHMQLPPDVTRQSPHDCHTQTARRLHAKKMAYAYAIYSLPRQYGAKTAGTGIFKRNLHVLATFLTSAVRKHIFTTRNNRKLRC